MKKPGRLVALALFFWVGAAEAGPYDRLQNTITNDESYKVRMQAIRVLTKALTKAGRAPSDAVMKTLTNAARYDPEHLVRGLACFALGKIGDPRARRTLEAARQDSQAFVREQAKQALQKLRGGAAPAGGRVLVIGTVDVPGVTVPAEIKARLEQKLKAGFSAAAGGFKVGERTGKGFHMKGSIAELSVKPDGDKSRVTIVVKVSIATWPENNLRHVMSARASARTKVPSGPSLVRLQGRLLDAAVKKAVQDSMAQVGGG